MMLMKKSICLLFFLLLSPLAIIVAQDDSLAVDGHQVVTLGNSGGELDKAIADSLYAKEQYRSAADIYESLLSDKGEAPAVYYNLGNAYYRLGMYAKAILNYERALLLAPSDEDVKTNLALAYSKTVDKYEDEGAMFYARWFDGVKHAMPSDAWAWLAVSSFLAFLLLLSLYIWSKRVVLKKIGFYCSLVCLLVSVVGNVCAFSQRADILARDHAVIMEPSVTVKSTPSDAGTALFVIHEGYKVNVRDNSMSDWVEISISAEQSGWVPRSSLEII